MSKHTTSMIADADGLFAAHLSDGGIRVMLRGKAGIDLPASHALFAEAAAQTNETIETFFDSLIERGVIALRDVR